MKRRPTKLEKVLTVMTKIKLKIDEIRKGKKIINK